MTKRNKKSLQFIYQACQNTRITIVDIVGRADGKTCQQPQVVRVYNIIIGHIEYIFDMFSQITYMAEN